MSSRPVTISVIVPCYNGGAFLEATLRSALAQTFPAIEIIVIDDGSTDESAVIAERAGAGAPVRVIRQHNQGESVARNRGIAEARGTHVLFLDADDLLAPEALDRLSAAIDGQPRAVALMGAAWFSDDPLRPTGIKPAAQSAFLPGIIEGNFAPPHAWLTPLELVRRVGGFHESVRWFEDWDLWWRIGVIGPPLHSVDYIGALYRQHAGSQLATTKMTDRTRGHAQLMERMATAFLEDGSLIQRHGGPLFWNCWAALTRARTHNVPWSDLDGLMRNMRQVLRLHPAELAGSWTARAMWLLGARAAVGLDRIVRRPTSEGPNSSPTI
jgi:glycosyltransferase involved in cell wall biosynthesis